MKETELAFLLVIGAGMSTGIGASVVYSNAVIKVTSKEALAFALGLSAGVMMYVSFVEIFYKSIISFENSGRDERGAYLYATLCFFGGIVVMKMIDALVHTMDPSHMNHDDIDFEILHEIMERNDLDNAASTTGAGSFVASPAPGDENENEILSQNENFHLTETTEINCSRLDSSSSTEAAAAVNLGDIEMNGSGTATTPRIERDVESVLSLEKKKAVIDQKLHRMGLMTALAIGIHNFPEGLATFVATLSDPSVGVAIAVAIAIHNIPEGLCVSVPIFFATNNRHKAFAWGVLSGLSEIVGAGLGWVILKDVFNDMIYALLFGLVAGMMIYICIFQLIPTAIRYDPQDKYVSNATVVGMAVMAVSLVAFKY